MAVDRTIDDIDTAILMMLQENARVSQADIARAVGLAPSAVLERIRKLEARRVIKGYAAQINPDAVDRSMLAFVAVRTTDRPGETRVAQTVAAVPDVLEVHHVAGDDCLVLKIRASNPSHLVADSARPPWTDRWHSIDAHDDRARDRERGIAFADRRASAD